jgi:type I restriction enzyme R subunit
MDRRISADYVTQITAQVNIFNVEAFTAEVEKLEGAATRADTIAHQMKRVITALMEQDPAFYKTFSDLIEEAIAEYKQGRISEVEYLEQISARYRQFVAGTAGNKPVKLRAHKHAAAYYGVVKEPLFAHHSASDQAHGVDADELSADIAIRIEEMIERHKIRDWVHNADVQAQMKNDIEDYLYSIKGRYNIALTWNEIDTILDQVIHIAKQRNQL